MKWAFLTRNKAWPNLELELLHPYAVRNRLGIFVLLLGVTLTICALLHYFYFQQRTATTLAEMMPISEKRVGKGSVGNKAEIKAVKESLDRIALPWGSLFVALESAQTGAVHLISVEPDSQKLTLKVVAEAPDVYEMLKYLRALKGQTGLQEVFLSEYEIGESTPDKPMRFTVTATWDRTQ